MSTHYEASNHGLRELVAAYNKFGFKLFRELADRQADKNILLSPASVALSLALIYHGAGGKTQQAIADVLWPEGIESETVSHNNAILLSTFDALNSQVQIIVAIALWIDKNLVFDPAFQDLADKFYKADTTTIDFEDPSTSDVINHWAREKTGGKIDRLLDENDLRATVESILTNAVYFKGLWATPFDEEATREGVFHLPGGKQKSVPMMSQMVNCLYLQEDAFHAIGLDYRGGRFSMYIFLPDEKLSLKIFLSNLNELNWEHWLAGFDDSQVELLLPRFELKSECDLKEALSNLGMGIAFTGGADFSPMGLGHHFISKIKQNAMVEVNEEGTEAAAATAVLMGRSAMTPFPLIINRPFFWALRDNKNGMVLFTGVVVDPD